MDVYHGKYRVFQRMHGDQLAYRALMQTVVSEPQVQSAAELVEATHHEIGVAKARPVHVPIGEANDTHSGGDRGGYAVRSILDHDAFFRAGAERFGRDQENIGRRLAAGDARVVAADHGPEDRKPRAVRSRLDFEQCLLGAGRDRHGDAAPVELTRERFCAGYGQVVSRSLSSRGWRCSRYSAAVMGSSSFSMRNSAESKGGDP